MNWFEDLSELPTTTHETPAGYHANNHHDWPQQICGNLSLADIVEVAKGIPSLEISDQDPVQGDQQS